MKKPIYVMPCGKRTRTGSRSRILKSLTTAAAQQIANALQYGAQSGAGKQFGDVLPDTTLISWRNGVLHSIEHCANNTEFQFLSTVPTIGEA